MIRGVIVIAIWILVIDVKNVAFAEQEATCTKDGDITFATVDTKATTGTKWSTVGFTIRRDKSKGNPVMDDKYVSMVMKPSYRTVVYQDDGTYLQTFNVPRKDIEAELIHSGIAEYGDENILYLNGIFSVTRNGVVDKAYYRTLSGIKNAAEWRNENDFNDFFDIKVSFAIDKYPVYIEYRTSKNEVITCEKIGKVRGGKKVNISLESYKSYQNQEYKLCRSYIQYLSNTSQKIKDIGISKGYTMDQICHREEIQQVDGIKFVAMMKKEKKDVPDSPDEINVSLDEIIDGVGTIASEKRHNEKFDVLKGIPSSEAVYTNVFTPEYLVSYGFKKKIGEKIYPLKISKTYHLTWFHNGAKQADKTVTKTYYVKRKYSYWMIDTLNVYIPNKAVIQNAALPGGKVLMKAGSINYPRISYEKWEKEGDHIVEPEYDNSITVSSATIVGGSSKPSIPDEDFTEYAETCVGIIEARNDKLLFNSTVIMSDIYKDKYTEKPVKIPPEDTLVGENVFYNKNLLIDKNQKNGTYISQGRVSYKAFLQINSTDDSIITYPLMEVNDVVVHTPTICNALIEDKYGLCQLIKPDEYRASLVLDTTFQVILPTEGQHKSIPGYYYNDYSKYIASRQVKFPFDVYKNDIYISQGTWTSIGNQAEFYLPIWVEEGHYSINFRSISINAQANDKLYAEEAYCNESRDNYVATDTIPVEVSGRVYGLKIFDISDYPIWKNVFRMKNSLKLTGFRFGVDSLPLIRGSHPFFNNMGVMKTGYTLRMSLNTIGNMDSKEDYIHVKPRFYYINENGTGRQEVDVYYKETISDKLKRLIKIGGEVDGSNVKTLTLGDPFLDVKENELQTTSKIKNLTLEVLKDTIHKVYTFHNIMIPSGMQTLIGADYTRTKGIAMTNVTLANQASKGMQKWYFEYYLPSDLYVLPKNKDLFSYGKEHPIDFTESFWLKDGYLILNYSIETIKKGKRHLSYINTGNEAKGYCNMWKKEGFQEKRVDSLGNTYIMKEGDICLFHLKKSAALDYRSGGTH